MIFLDILISQHHNAVIYICMCSRVCNTNSNKSRNIFKKHLVSAMGGITKQFDKSGFDQLVQLSKLLFPQGNQFSHLIQCGNNVYLLVHWRDRHCNPPNHFTIQVVDHSANCHVLKFLVGRGRTQIVIQESLIENSVIIPQYEPSVVNASINLQNIGSSKTHGIGKQEITGLHITGLFHSFRYYFLCCLCDVH